MPHSRKQSSNLYRLSPPWSYGASIRLFVFIAMAALIVNFQIFHESMHEKNSKTANAQRSLTDKHFASRSRVSSIADQPLAGLSKANVSLDFIIAGFPKCGTTTLLYAFSAHEETDISAKERCSFTSPQITDSRALHRLYTESLKQLDPSTKRKRGIKCPTAIRNTDSIERLHMYAPLAKLIIGVRHPVFFLQSYFNYRVTENYDKNLKLKVPALDTLVGSISWRGVSTDAARFELFLMQLGKTNMSTTDFGQLFNHPHMGVQPNNMTIFLYTLEQMEDPNRERAARFRGELEAFLGLKQPLRPLGHENINHFVANDAHKETVNICTSNFKPLRDLLVEQGRKSSKWIRESFIKSNDVTVANRAHFEMLLQSWNSDPCKGKGIETLKHP